MAQTSALLFLLLVTFQVSLAFKVFTIKPLRTPPIYDLNPDDDSYPLDPESNQINSANTEADKSHFIAKPKNTETSITPEEPKESKKPKKISKKPKKESNPESNQTESANTEPDKSHFITKPKNTATSTTPEGPKESKKPQKGSKKPQKGSKKPKKISKKPKQDPDDESYPLDPESNQTNSAYTEPDKSHFITKPKNIGTSTTPEEPKESIKPKKISKKPQKGSKKPKKISKKPQKISKKPQKISKKPKKISKKPKKESNPESNQTIDSANSEPDESHFITKPMNTETSTTPEEPKESKKPKQECTGLNEEYDEFGTKCGESCNEFKLRLLDQSSAIVQCPANLKGEPGCYCRKGFYRRAENNKCVTDLACLVVL